MSQTYESDQFASPVRKQRLTRMPKIANLAAASYFHRTDPIVSARWPGAHGAPSTETSPDLPSLNRLLAEGKRSSPTLPLAEASLSIRSDLGTETFDVPGFDAESLSVASDLSTCQHHRSHAIIQGRMVPLCLQCEERREGRQLPASSHVTTAHASATIAVGARPLLHTMQGFPFDMRCSDVEAGRLMELPMELDEISQAPGSFGQRQLALSRSNAQRAKTERVGSG